MKRVLPRPILAATVFATWLALNETLHPAHLLLAALLALTLPRWLGRLIPAARVASRPLVALRLLGRLLRDIVVSNLQVARRILGPESAIHPGFVWMPLRLRDPYATATLAAIVTVTPGTLSADISADGRWLLIHALDAGDERSLLESVRRRYEDPLLELFP
jgi:multicomponent K+:H+ antiporter subunit E